MLIKGRLSEEEKQIIKKMRNQNIGYTEIANKLNCKKDRVKKYCQKQIRWENPTISTGI